MPDQKLPDYPADSMLVAVAALLVAVAAVVLLFDALAALLLTAAGIFDQPLPDELVLQHVKCHPTHQDL